MQINVLTLFPEMFPGTLGHGLAGKALARGDWGLNVINPRDFTQDVHKTVDDTPYGGGAGMVLRPDILSQAMESVTGRGRLIVPSPRGVPFTQAVAETLANEAQLTFVCGRYEAIDQRFLNYYEVQEISLGDYILSGGELGVQVILDAVLRLRPGTLGNTATHTEESFSAALVGGLEYPHYTRPANWEAPDGHTYAVPDVLRSGNHAQIQNWREEQSHKLTKQRRPDLLV